MKPELHLFILWEKARRVESRILEDLARQKDIAVVGKWELSFPGPAAEAFPAFYGRRKPVDGRLKARKCGCGAFLLVVVRNLNPTYGSRWARDDKYYQANELMYDLKTRYREWAGRKHRVHGTTDRDEFARDVFLLTGHTADEWERGVPDGIYQTEDGDTVTASALMNAGVCPDFPREDFTSCVMVFEKK